MLLIRHEVYLVGGLEFPFNASNKERLNHIIFTAQKDRAISFYYVLKYNIV
jgi:hypothetical protein